MSESKDLEELVTYLARTSRLTSQESARVVREVLAFLDETAEDFIRRRHRELQRAGRANPEIFQLIRMEMALRRFSAREFSERQVRRIVYG